MARARDGVLVVGGGVSGLTTAVVLAESGRPVRLVSDRPPESTTSAVAGGLWEPYLAEPRERVAGWAFATLPTLTALAERPAETGVRMVAGVKAQRTPEPVPPWWLPRLPEALRPLRPDEVPRGFRSGYAATLPLLDMPAYLAFLARRLRDAGGVLERRRLGSLAEAEAESALVVNCSGLAAHGLVPDPEVRPIQGQLVVVENPGVDRWLVEEPTEGAETTYLLPQPAGLLLGGTARRDRWTTEPDPTLAARIVARCAAIHPEIAGARVLEHRVGLRPARPAVRLEAERGRDGGGLVVHNYGHGGCGVTVSWGCAREVAGLLPD
ncbi:FAD-dependent oxidoreductase [Streptomyces sp. 3MP-14]|uniref:D-amino-acid oxidase n=1 Tax=Streptomyces mimosae TaxID=2586635 RepID=A0A5N6A1S5_9ACTN|nr:MULTISPECIES: FAD-dependent oxidoreductase [Streptomyces]KAB8161288.1 FAD-dependent oxidoreductase [Streptomyces mimosae]KAB8173090.1 FAD-dependent oxidoreductase [Streptomyces sp. 3MP-14]